MVRKVVVTGYGAVSPLGLDSTSLWEGLKQGKSGIGMITQFDASHFDAHIAGEVKNFVSPSFIALKDLKRVPRFVQFSLQATDEAIKMSKLDISNIDPYRVGVIVGSGVGCLDIMEKESKILLERGPKKLTPFMIPMLITNEAAGNVAIYFNLKGINFCTVTACASGAHAIGEAYWAIKAGRADVMIAGGTEACITALGVGGFCALRALSTLNDQPEKASRPFDLNRDGFVMAEGAGIVVLEDLEHAQKRGAKIYGEVAGVGATCDAYHITAPNPDGESVAKAINLALKDIKHNKPEELYINAHGTSTELNDKIETKAIKMVFGDQAEKLHISSTKSMIGHTLGAAGAIEFIIGCLVLNEGIVPPTINYETKDPECDLNYTPNQAVKANVKAVVSNSLGFGGHNISLAIKKLE